MCAWSREARRESFLLSRHGWVLCALLLLPWMSACEIATETVESPAPRIVVHAVLNPDAREQVILVESSLTGRVTVDSTLRFNPLDPIRTAGGEPLFGATVQLFREHQTSGVGAVETVVVDAIETLVNFRRTGRYTVSRNQLVIEPGVRYRLFVRTADGREVTGETRVPAAPTGWVPGAGEVVRPVSINRSTDTLRLEWSPSEGARTYAIRVETPNGPWFLFSDSTRFALAGTLRNFFASDLPSVFAPGFEQLVSVAAVDVNFYDYNLSGNDPFGGTGLISSVRGGLGLFGSVLQLERRNVSVTERDRFPLDARWVGVTASGDSAEYDLWVDSPGTPRSSVSGRARIGGGRLFLIGTLEGGQLRLATLAGSNAVGTLALLNAVVVGDTIRGEYDPRFDTNGPRVLVRRARISPVSWILRPKGSG